MNKQINKLIPELRFPEFVKDGEWSEEIIENIAKAESSSVAFNKLDIKKEGYPVYGADSIVGYIDSYQHKEEYISIVKDGSGVGRLNFCKSESTILGTLISLKSKDKKKYNLNWIYYLLNTIDFSSYVKGGGIPHIYYSDYKNEKVLVPNPTEQQKIATCLSSLDELITAHTNKLETLKSYKKGLMQNLCPQDREKVPKFRFKEFEKDGNWAEKKLKNVFSIFQGYAFSSQDNTPNGVRWLKIADVGIQQMKKDNPTYLPINYKEEFERFIVKKGDYVLALTRPILNMELKIAIIDDEFNNSLLNQRVGKIITSNDINFIYYLLHTKKMVMNINKNIEGNDPPNLSFQQIENILVNIPIEINEQKKIASTLSSLDELINEQADKIEQLKLHKKGLMQGLFPKLKN